MDDPDNTDSSLIRGKFELQMFDCNILLLLQALANENTNSSLCKWKIMLLQKHKQQGRNMVYPRPTDPDFLAVILIPEPPFPQNFDPWALIKNWSHPCFTQNFNLDNFVYLQI